MDQLGLSKRKEPDKDEVCKSGLEYRGCGSCGNQSPASVDGKRTGRSKLIDKRNGQLLECGRGRLIDPKVGSEGEE